jgi:hypothetical protein
MYRAWYCVYSPKLLLITSKSEKFQNQKHFWPQAFLEIDIVQFLTSVPSLTPDLFPGCGWPKLAIIYNAK